MDTMAFLDKNALFEDLDNMAAYAALSNEDRVQYDADVKAYRDMRGQLEFAEQRGKLETQLSMIKNMLKQGMSLESISQIAELTIDKIKALLND